MSSYEDIILPSIIALGAGVALYLFYNSDIRKTIFPQEGDTISTPCEYGGTTTQKYQGGVWNPPCSKGYSLTVTITE